MPRGKFANQKHCPDLRSASDRSCRVGNLPIRSPTQIWVVTRHQYGISALVSQTSFGGETSGSVAKCQLFSQASLETAKNLLVLMMISLLAQWNLDLTKCQGTGEICSLYRAFVLYRTPPFNEFYGKLLKCSSYRGIVKNLIYKTQYFRI